MQCIITLLELLFIFGISFIIGLPFTKILLPKDIEETYSTYITPVVGYLVFCLVGFTISSTFKLPMVSTCWMTLAALVAAGCATQLKPQWRIALPAFKGDLKHCLLLMLPMAILILFPLFYFGAKTYLGAVNPDFFSGVTDNYYLLKGHSFADFKAGTDNHFPIDYMAGTISASARFGAGIFAILVQILLKETTRAALALSIGFFLLNLPLIIYFFSSVVLGFTRKQATLASLLIGISGPIGMSYLYYYVGQNSGLPALPLVMAASYLMLTRPSIKTLLFCALLSNALFINYFAMLPYALAPAGVLGIYLLFKRQLSIKQALGLFFGFIVMFILLHLGNINSIIASMQAWGSVIGQTLQGQFFLEFLTELFVPLFFGTVEYPVDSSLLGKYFGYVQGTYTALIITGFVIAFWIWAVSSWLKDKKETQRKVFIIAAFVIYAAVWWVYTFPRQYAYAVFKMSSWLQFMLVPFMAYGILKLKDNLKNSLSLKYIVTNTLAILGLFVGIVYMSCNVVTNLQYASNGFGRNTTSGYIINNFEMSGNKDYFKLEKAISKIVKPNESIAVLFVDSIENYWVSYYLHKFRQSIPFHETMPGDDENLPNITTNTVMDYYGNIRSTDNVLAHDYDDRYFLTWNKDHLNQDIVDSNYTVKPIWENHTFRLFDGNQIHDILATGRGFYRLEYFKPQSYWTPKAMRWSAQGGEFYLLKVKNPGKPYRLVFDAMVGYEASDGRTLDLWLNGKKFQTLKVTQTARVVSQPFYPQKGMNKIVVYIEDYNKPMGRKVSLWNKDIPGDYRRLNIAFSDVHILTPDAPQKFEMVPVGETINFIDFFKYATAFNGLQLDGWIGDNASITMAVPPQVKKMELNGFIPGGTYSFPYKLIAKINGNTSTQLIQKGGDFTVNFPVPAHSKDVEVVLSPSQSQEASNEEERHKTFKQSLILQSVKFT